jgi:nitrate reductase alpha subunit
LGQHGAQNDTKRKEYQSLRGLGGFVRSSWDEVNEMIAAANVYTIKNTARPGDGFLAHSSHVHGQLRRRQPLPEPDWWRVHELLRLVLRLAAVSSPQIWGEQTDVPESADWYNSSYIIAWGSNVPQTRTPDAHFFTEVRYKGTKTVAVTPDYSEVAKLSDIWMKPKQGTDAAVAMAMGHVILKEFFFDKRSAYFDDYVRRYTDMPMLVMLKETCCQR